MSFFRDMAANPWLALCVKVLAITFVGRFVLDAATSWTVDEPRSAVFACVVLGWSAAVVLAGCLYAGGLGVLAALVVCVWNVVGLLRERADEA